MNPSRRIDFTIEVVSSPKNSEEKTPAMSDATIKADGVATPIIIGKQRSSSAEVHLVNSKNMAPLSDSAKIKNEKMIKNLDEKVSKVKEFFINLKAGIIKVCKSIRQWFSSLMKVNRGGSKNLSVEMLSPKDKIEKEISHLSASQKKERMDYFVELFQEGGHLSTVGIFREAGSEKELSKLMLSFASESFKALPPKLGTHEAATMFKRFIKGCHLFNADVQASLSECADLEKSKDLVESLNEAIGKMSKEHQQLLKGLLSICGKVVERAEENKMDAANVATCMGTNLFSLDSSLPMQDVVKKAGLHNKATELLIVNRSQLKFSKLDT